MSWYRENGVFGPTLETRWIGRRAGCPPGLPMSGASLDRMAENTSRSCNAELAEGMSDGTYKKVRPNTGGVVEGTTAANRKMLSDTYYGVHEAREKPLGDGTTHVTPDFVETAPFRLT